MGRLDPGVWKTWIVLLGSHLPCVLMFLLRLSESPTLNLRPGSCLAGNRSCCKSLNVTATSHPPWKASFTILLLPSDSWILSASSSVMFPEPWWRCPSSTQPKVQTGGGGALRGSPLPEELLTADGWWSREKRSSLVDFPGSWGWPHTRAHMGSTSWTYWVIEK